MSISIKDVTDDLTAVNELGDGEREYFTEDGRLFVRVYEDERDPQKLTGTYRVGISIESVEHQGVQR